MLEPRTAIRSLVDLRPLGERSAPARRGRRSRARSQVPSVSPWPRLSKVSAAKPWPAAARAKSAWFSLREPGAVQHDHAAGTARAASAAVRCRRGSQQVDEAMPSQRPVSLGLVRPAGSVLHNVRGRYGGHRPQPRVSPRHARQRARPPRGRRLRRRRAGRALRHARRTSTPRTTCAPVRAPTWRRSPPARTTSR